VKSALDLWSLATALHFHSNLKSQTSNLKFIIMFKNLKTWKTIIQFIITVLTAIVGSFLTQSCCL